MHKIAIVQRNPDPNKRGWVCETSWSHLCSSGKMRILPNSIKTCETCDAKWGVIKGWWTALMAHDKFEQTCGFFSAVIGVGHWLKKGAKKKLKIIKPKG